jgi:hypothetical protein
MQLITSVRPTEHRQDMALKRVVRAGDRDARWEPFEVGSVWSSIEKDSSVLRCSSRRRPLKLSMNWLVNRPSLCSAGYSLRAS